MLKTFLKIPEKTHFTIHNIPFGAGRTTSKSRQFCASRIGDHIINLSILENHGLFEDLYKGKLFNTTSLNKFMSEERETWKSVRSRIQSLFSEDSSIQNNNDLLSQALVSQENFINKFPVKKGEFTDFYSGNYNVFRNGVMHKGISVFSKNLTHMPLAYSGRSSSVSISDKIIRPRGQILRKNGEPVLAPTKKLDFEVEIGYFIGGKTNKLSHSISLSHAPQNLFGIVILNDWSARDIQHWEIAPLGPFTSKNFASTISPWIVTQEALEPFKVKPAENPHALLPYLSGPTFTYDVGLKTYLSSKTSEPSLVSSTNLKHIYWSFAQQIAHHTISGCSLSVGDLIGSGTISSPEASGLGCMIEMTKDGKTPLTLASGEKRSYLSNHDTVTIEAFCSDGKTSLGLGSISTKIYPSRDAVSN